MKTSEECLSYIQDRLYYPKTGLLYDCIIENETVLPTAEEIAADIPNANGCSTVMEDCMITGGTLLHGLCAQMERTDGSGSGFAAQIADGMLKSAAQGKDGYIPRGVHPSDGKLHYRDCSRDQITMCLYGLLRYASSGFCSGEMKERIAALAKRTADRAIRNVIPENDCNLLTEDGKPSLNGRFWGEKCGTHEIFRLPQIYLTAYVLTGEERYYTHYLSVRDEALERSHPVEDCWAMYCFQQMAVSLDTARRFDRDPRIREVCGAILDEIADYAGQKLPVIRNHIAEAPETAFSVRGYYVPFYYIQDAAIVPMLEALAPHRGVSPAWEALCRETLEKLPYSGKTALPVHFFTALELMRQYHK